ncbi:MAG: efflux RND transporter periplasmic adaptor subunit [Pseudomonadota bacterium]
MSVLATSAPTLVGPAVSALTPAALTSAAATSTAAVTSPTVVWGGTPALAATDENADAPKQWTCPMHPHYIATEFGPCPICGMDLVPQAAGNDLASADADARTIVTVAPEMMQSMGVRLAKAETSMFGRNVRSFGIVRANERLRTEITARVEGWFEKLYVTAVGDDVSDGQKLFDLYSPQLIVAQSDFQRGTRSERKSTRGLTQLRSFGVQSQALTMIRKRRTPMDTVPFFAPRSGTISELALADGTYVKRGMRLAKIQDYSSVWLIVSAQESDLGFITKATKANVTFPNLPGRKVRASVDYIYPTIDAQTRTGQVRLVLDNPDGQIRPGSYADVVFEVGTEQRIAVPSEAVLRSEQGKYIIASLGQGRFEPRPIETGLVSGRWTEVTGGIAAGDNLVVSGQFLLDSESALRESFRKLERLQLPLSLLDLTDTQFAMVDHMVDAALYMHEALVDGYDVEPTFFDPAISIRDLLWPRFKNTKLAFILDDAVAALRKAQDAKAESEVQAALADLAAALRPWLLTGAPDHYRSKNVALYKEKEGSRVWLQVTGGPINPYARAPGVVVPYPAPAPSVANAPTEPEPSTPSVTTAQANTAASDPDGTPPKTAMRGSHNGN